MNKKLTLLESYWKMRLGFEEAAKETPPSASQLWIYQELLYRIGALEIFQMLAKAAPFSCDMQALIPHYQVVNAYIETLRKERCVVSKDTETVQKQHTAWSSFDSVVKDYRARYASYAPGSPEQYGRDIGRTIATVLPAWIQFRNTVIEIKLTEEAAA